jgi:hypothetical protein
MLILLLACSPRPGLVPASESLAPAAPASAPASKPVAAASEDVFPAPARLVAVGDLHGDVPGAIGALRLAGMVDAAGHWTGGASWLVQTGDVLDRGPSGPSMLKWLGQLEAEAAAAGGRALLLNGNHEAMNVVGDWRYVADTAEFPGDTEAARESARHAYFSADGAGGTWVRTHRIAVQVGGTVFVHGGIDSSWASHGISGLNSLFREAIASSTGSAPASPTQPPVLGPDGPIWNRAYLLADPPVACAELTRALALLHADRMVVGHTTQDSGTIASRCEGHLYGIDTGISAYYGTHPAALVIESGPNGEAVTVLPR